MNTNPENLRLTTGKLLWLPSGETGYIDFGNCTSHKQAPDVQRVDHWRFANGVKRVDHSLVSSLKPKRVFTFDEHFAATLALQNFAVAVEVTTGGGSAPSEDYSPATPVGAVIDLGYRNISALVVKRSSDLATLTLNVDYLADLVGGLVTVLANAETDWAISFNYAAVTALNFTMFSRLLCEGTFRFLEYDQYDAVPAGNETFRGTVFVTGWGDGSTDKFQEFTVEVISQE